jgi:tetratricopeptide (TPR) repeat protein
MPRSLLAISALLVTFTLRLSAQSVQDSVRRLADDGRLEEAYRLGREAVSASPDDPASLAALAVGALAVERYDEAMEAAEAAQSRKPDVSSYQLIMGQAYLSHARANPSLSAIARVKKGRAAVERAIALDPDNLPARHTLMQFLLQAPGIAGGSRDGARAQAREILRRNRAYGLIAVTEVAAAEADEAELTRVLDVATPLLGQAEDSAAVLMGALLGAVARLPDEGARERFTQRIYAAHPGHPVAAYHRARLWVIEGKRLAEAERLLLGYLAVPERRRGLASRAGAHWRLGQLYERQDRDEVAKEQYRLAATLDPRLARGKRRPGRLESEL